MSFFLAMSFLVLCWSDLLMLCWSVLIMLCWSDLQISLFVVLSCHLGFRMYLRHLLMNVCNIQVIVLVTLHVSEPYSGTLFTLVLKILILLRVEKDGVFHTVFKMLNACLAFPILFLTYSSVPLCLPLHFPDG